MVEVLARHKGHTTVLTKVEITLIKTAVIMFSRTSSALSILYLFCHTTQLKKQSQGVRSGFLVGHSFGL